MMNRRTPSLIRARRLGTLALVGLLALGGGTALALSTAPQALALNPLTNDVLEYTPIDHSPYLFFGTADPGDPITVDSNGHGPDCNTVTLPAGTWSCNLILTSSTDVTVITATRPDDGTPAQDSEGWEYTISLPPTVTENFPGEVVRTNPATPITGSGAWPTATMQVTVNGAPAACGAADGAGNWSCVPPALADGSYPIDARQTVAGVQSFPTNSTYRLDTSTITPISATPFDSSLPAGLTQTSDVTPFIGGGPGGAEPLATVNVFVDDRGVVPIAHPATPAATFWCSDQAALDGSWGCTGPPLTATHFYEVSFTAFDLPGNVSPGPLDEFSIEILPPPTAPTFDPIGVPGELSPIDVSGTIDNVTTNVTVFEGATDLCGPIAPTFPTYTCPGPVFLAPGAHVLDITAYDVYGTGTTTQVNVVTWPDPVIDTPLALSQTSQPSVHITGDAPIGSILTVLVDGVAQPGCSGVVPGPIPEFDCMSTLLAIGPHSVTAEFDDPNGDTSALVGNNFDIVPGPVPVVVSAPTIGYSSTDPVVHVAFTGQPPGTTYVQEGATVLCAPAALVVSAFSCDTIPLSVGVHNLTFAQYDQYGTLSAPVNRMVTILPSPVPKPLTMKTFGFSFSVMNPDGSPIDPAGLRTGDLVTVEATGVPPGTQLITEIHSTPIQLGSQMVGGTGVMRLTTEVPVVPPGAHEIVVTASAPGYFPAAFRQPFAVHGLKQITNPDDVIKTLGEPETVKELGTPADGAAGSGGARPGTGGGTGFTDPSQFGSSVDSPFDAPAHAFALSPAGIVLSGSIALAFLLLVGLPAELLESTIRSNYDRAFGWLARLKRRASRMLAPIARLLARPWVGSAVTILAASIMLGFADPDFGFTGASVRLVLAMVAAVVAINIGISIIVMKVAKRAFDMSSVLQPMPAALAIVGVSVLVSRLAGISPGFLFGIVLGVAYARELKLRDEARLGILTAGLTIAAGLLAWIGYGIASATIAGQGFFNNLLIEALAAVTLEALGTLVVALLPIEFLDGRTIFRWSKPAWLGLYAVTALIFVFVVVPLSDNWGTMSAPIFGWGTLFAVFAAVAIITWAVFRRRARVSPSRIRPSSREDAAPPQRSRR